MAERKLTAPECAIARYLALKQLRKRGEETALAAWRRACRLDPAVFERKGIVPLAGADLARQYYVYAKLFAARGCTARAFEYLARALGLGLQGPLPDRARPGLRRAGRRPALRGDAVGWVHAPRLTITA